MRKPRGMVVRVERIAFKDCKRAAETLIGTDEEIDQYAHELEKQFGLYDAWDYIRDCGIDDTNKDFSPLVASYEISAHDWLCWVLDKNGR